jgi:hypothetical protein
MPSYKKVLFSFSLITLLYALNAGNCLAQQTAIWHAQTILLNIMQNKPVEENVAALATYPLSNLQNELHSDSLKKVFWIYLYNSFIQLTITDSVSRANEKVFFGKKVIKVAGKDLSLYDIENGMLRKSRTSKFKMYRTKWLVSSFEKKLRVLQRDWRFFFALNTGIEKDPLIWFYMPELVYWEIDKQVLAYFSKNSKNGILNISLSFKKYLNDAGGKEIILKWADDKKIAIKDLNFKKFPGTLHIRKFPTIENH